ncbi:MAG: PD-(D/E)XK nuclease family protein [Pseudomonadota bacterium]
MTIYSLPPGARFAALFAEGFWERFGASPPEEIARISILANNQRASRVITDALARSGGPARLMPRIGVVADLGKDPIIASDLPPEIDPLRRQLRLTRLVEAYLRREGGDRMAALSAAPELARTLASLLDDCDEAGLDLDRLDAATEGEHSEHWARNLSFFELIRTYWPKIAAEEEGGALGPKARQRMVIERLAEAWATQPPDHPVIVAGSTGSIVTTAMLMEAVAKLPKGIVILPGLDRNLDPEIWSVIKDGAVPDHPQAPFTGILGRLDIEPSQVPPWSREWPREERQTLLAQAMRPAPVTDAWYASADVLRGVVGKAVESVTLVEAPSPRHEAAAIALATRRALETSGKAVLILSQDAALGRRIAAELRRFGIEADDSLGRPLAQSPPAVFLRLIAELAEGRAGPVEIAALLSHPLCEAGHDRAVHCRHAAEYERAVLRGRGVQKTGGLPPWPESTEDQAKWFGGIAGAVAPLIEAVNHGMALRELAARHLSAAERLSDAGEGEPAVWAREAGQAVETLMLRLVAASDAFGQEPVIDYSQILLNLMRNEEIRQPGQAPHPRVTMMSPRESRVASADLVILAGLNEGSWPVLPGADPWLSRPMRAAIGLSQPERVIGLAAHDFLQAALAPEVILSRSVKVDGTPTIPSRWITRLEILIDGLDRQGGSEPETVKALRDLGDILLQLVHLTQRPDGEMKRLLPRAARPAPSPPAEVRPHSLSVTTIERLIRDPYAVYARRILKLEPLDPLGDAPDFRDRGILIHRILETFGRETPGDLPPDAAEQLDRITDEVLSAAIASPSLRRIWRARVGRFSEWFLQEEAQRRAHGKPLGFEVSGQLDLKMPPNHKVTAVADRIDKLNGGGAAIYDYKAGAPPSQKQIDLGFNQQLHLQAAIVAAGGFKGIPAVEARQGAYIGLTGSGDGGQCREVEDLSAKVEAHLAQVADLLATYARAETPYPPRIGMEKRTDRSDYDHLARFGEWEDGDA